MGAGKKEELGIRSRDSDISITIVMVTLTTSLFTIVMVTFLLLYSIPGLCLQNGSLWGGWREGGSSQQSEGSFKQLIHPGILRASFHLYIFGN